MGMLFTPEVVPEGADSPVLMLIPEAGKTSFYERAT